MTGVLYNFFKLLYVYLFTHLFLIWRPTTGSKTITSNWNSLKMVKNVFCFILKAFFVLKILKFMFWLFGHVGKGLDKKVEFNLKIYGITDCIKNSCSLSIKFGQLIEYNVRNIFLRKSCRKWRRETSSRPTSVFKRVL